MSNLPNKQFEGLYVPGGTFLHKLDPRSKLVAFPVLIFTGFWIENWLYLGVPVLILFYWLSIIPGQIYRYLQLISRIRYLLLFTLLVHLLFTPGFTLFGVSWLSRDGLFFGLQVCVQLALALGFSLLLASTTSSVCLALGLERLVSPLKCFGVPVSLVGDSLTLVLIFLERLTVRLNEKSDVHQSRRSFKACFDRIISRFSDIFGEFIEIAENMSRCLAAGERPANWVSAKEELVLGFTGKDTIFLLVLVSACVTLWSLA